MERATAVNQLRPLLLLPLLTRAALGLWLAVALAAPSIVMAGAIAVATQVIWVIAASGLLVAMAARITLIVETVMKVAIRVATVVVRAVMVVAGALEAQVVDLSSVVRVVPVAKTVFRSDGASVSSAWTRFAWWTTRTSSVCVATCQTGARLSHAAKPAPALVTNVR